MDKSETKKSQFKELKRIIIFASACIAIYTSCFGILFALKVPTKNCLLLPLIPIISILTFYYLTKIIIYFIEEINEPIGVRYTNKKGETKLLKPIPLFFFWLKYKIKYKLKRKSKV
ncbi:MAG: hypothetical protein U9R23_04420 [Candidatus Cloacimonadota bacterium]|nr:hypothetical protein [Candidatus Cloacimonadota bacterium]